MEAQILLNEQEIDLLVQLLLGIEVHGTIGSLPQLPLTIQLLCKVRAAQEGIIEVRDADLLRRQRYEAAKDREAIDAANKLIGYTPNDTPIYGQMPNDQNV